MLDWANLRSASTSLYADEEAVVAEEEVTTAATSVSNKATNTSYASMAYVKK